MKQLFVSNLREGARIEDVFLVVSKSVSATRAGSPYLKLRLADNSGEVDAVKWDASELEISRTREDEFLLVHGTVRTYNDNLQLSLDSLQRWSDPVNPSDFIRSSDLDVDGMMTEFLGFMDQISDPHLKSLMNGIFADEQFAAKFRQAPAAARVHHAYVSGLLEHTLNVVRSCVAIAGLYPQVNKDLLIAGAALHDIGKVDEFTWTSSIKYSDEGQFVGHLVMGAMLVKQACAKIDGFDPMLSLTLQHLILSHHGTHEFGSPKLPSTIEAVILNRADDMDAQVAIFERAIEDSDNDGEEGAFTKRHYLLQRPLFKGIRKEQPNGKDKPKDEESDMGLFTSDFDPFADE